MQPFFDQLLGSSEPIMPEPDEEVDDCFQCHETKPVDEGEGVVVHTHRIEGRAVAQDVEFVCRDCLDEAEYMQWP